ncbi:hypothetical protein P775_21670 [Puniceibacterium antarcticum]|uniref:Response regulatory domain-containing protein n=1 Tax=Puniceibacterium antarcticum TaxID=1206336 RepID=A0A2G8R958_9RHOB|nr:response regulator [Puniceibacterium antarcticum]PIL18033.1 hypothetical protein P775_21670 [Puniceibacterium antarcticum]
MPNETEVTFLVVDDDEVSIMAIERAFQKLRLTNPVRIARDGLEALELLTCKEHDPIRRPFIILLDVNMPRMDGHEFLAALRGNSALKGSVVFMLTTSDAPKDLAAAYQQLVAGYIVKEDAYSSIRAAIELLDAYIKIVSLPEENTIFS